MHPRDVQLQVAIAARKLDGVDALPLLLQVLAKCGDDKLIPHIVWQNLQPLLEDHAAAFVALVRKTDLAKTPNLAALLPRAIERLLGSKKFDSPAVAGLVVLLCEDKSTNPANASRLSGADRRQGTNGRDFRRQAIFLVGKT